MSIIASYARTMAGAERIAQERMSAIETERRSLPAPKVKIKPARPPAIVSLRRRGMPDWAIDIFACVAASRGVSMDAMVGSVRSRAVVSARNEAVYRIKEAKVSLSSSMIARWFCRDHTTILFALASHQKETGAPELTKYDLATARRRNAAISAYRRQREKDAR